MNGPQAPAYGRGPLMANDQHTTDTHFSPIEVKLSRTQTPIPVVETIHLHSIYNPNKEAEGLIQKHEETLTQSNRILVLGLGFGYHVWALESFMGKHHNAWEIVVVEPDPKMVELFNENAPVEFSQNVKVVTNTNIAGFYDNLELVRFMATKPTLLAHPASFNLREVFFKNFMSFQASNRIADVAQKIENSNLRNHLLTLGMGHDDFDHEVSMHLQSGPLNQQDYLLGAFFELTSGVKA